MDTYKRQKYKNYFKLFISLALVIVQLGSLICVNASENSTAFTVTASQAADTQIKLEWNSLTNAQFYYIYKNNQATPIKTININSDINYLSYTDTGLNPETQYTYKITALDSKTNVLASATTAATTSSIAKPTILSAQYDVNSKNITLKWMHNSSIASGSIIKKLTASGNTTIGTISDTTVSYTFTDPISSSSDPLKYVIASKDNNGHYSLDSDPVTVLPINAPAILASIVNGIATISWTNNSYIEEFTLEVSKYDGTNWGSWTDTYAEIKAASQNIQHTPDSPGTYRYRLNAKNSTKYTGFSSISGPVSKLGVPTSLTGSFTDINKIDLSWTNDPGNTSDLKIERKIDSGNFTVISSLDKSKTSFTDTYDFKTGFTYYYKIVAFISDTDFAESSVYSLNINAPAAPSTLSANILSDSQVSLSWKDNSANEKGFIIERATDSGSYSQIGKVASGTTTYIDSTVNSKSTYSYRVSSYNPIGTSSGYSNIITCNTGTVASINYFTATPASSSQIDLTWTYSSNGKFATIIERKTGTEGTWTTVANLDSSITSYSDKSLLPNTQYFYRVKASLNLNVYSQVCPSDPKGYSVTTKMISPSNLSGSAPSYSQVDLSWTGTVDAVNYVIDRKQGNGNYINIASPLGNISAYSDKTVSPNASYTYRIKAVCSGNSSGYAEFSIISSPFSKPGNFKANAISQTEASLTWNDNSSTETGYEIWRASSTSALSVLYKTLDKNSTCFIDSGLDPNTQYTYKVRTCISASGTFSEFTDEITVKTISLNSPDHLQATIVSDTENDLSWTDNSNNERSFIVERKKGSDRVWTTFATLPANSSFYKDTGLDPDGIYFYRVSAYDDINNRLSQSGELEVASGLPSAPTGLLLNVLSSSEINLSWVDNSSPQSYKIERRTSSGQYSEIAIISSAQKSYKDINLVAGTQYFYRIRAYNDKGYSPYCSEMDAITNKQSVNFSDISNLSWAKDSIQNLADKGIIKGKYPGLFSPNLNITRAEFVCIIIRAFKLTSGTAGSFKDVTMGDWYYNEVSTAKALGIVSGSYEGNFFPNKPITRQDIAVIIDKTLKAASKPLPSHDTSILNKFSDKKLIKSYALSSMASLNGEGIMNGRSLSLISPADNATRAEAAVLINGILSR